MKIKDLTKWIQQYEDDRYEAVAQFQSDINFNREEYV